MEELAPEIGFTGPGLVPEYKTAGAAGADIKAYFPDEKFNSITLPPGEWQAISTGLSLEIPQGWEVQIRPKSGLALNFGLTVLNAPGTIDSDYRGVVKVILINHSSRPVVIHHGDAIAQMVVAPVARASFRIKAVLSETERGSGGFGSTGK